MSASEQEQVAPAIQAIFIVLRMKILEYEFDKSLVSSSSLEEEVGNL
jgi:hypothetical protein